MVQYPTNPEVIIIGAGAAGIGAGLELARRTIPFIIIEAKQRIGGRAYSETSSLGHLWDHGCHWFHSANINVLRAVADRLGHHYRKPPEDATYNAFIGGEWQVSGWDGAHAWSELGEISRRGREQDISAEHILDHGHPLCPLAHHWCQLMCSQDPELISARDYSSYNDTYENYAVEDGYGALIVRLADGLPVKLDTAASAVDLSGQEAKVETSAGTIRCKAVILAVPARMLEKNRIRLTPDLPHAVRQAFHDVPMGYYEKVAFAFGRPVLDTSRGDFADIFDPGALGNQPCSVEVHPFGRPIAVSHFGGAWVAEAKPSDLIDLAQSAIVHAFGADVRQHISQRTATTWTADPFIGGAYSCARPGLAHMRQSFATPVHDKLFICGEHAHRHFMATAHGAYETGLNAAALAAQALGRPLRDPQPGWFPS